jgi:ectoine hydroxylase-related dioxygenase (phytanoyl-CoA dioxygenase family)
MGLPEDLMPDIAGEVEIAGFALVSGVATSSDIASLIALFNTADIARVERGGETFGARNLLPLPEIRRTASSATLAAILTPLLGPEHQPVRALFFDKTEGANWPVLWHQDLSLAMKERREIPGWTNWSVKRGVPHVQPPAGILARMVTVRLHLDDCPKENGPLRVVAGSHRSGQLSREAIRTTVEGAEVITIAAAAGDALLMRPLILHASHSALTPHHRRVLHLEYAPAGLLPSQLEWAQMAL